MGTIHPWAIACLLLALIGSGLLLVSHRRVRSTTLAAPWYWTLIGVWSVTLAEVYRGMQGMDSSTGNQAWYFVLVVTTLLPGMALLGAQRPHDRTWQFVVASLWIILVLPAAKNLLLEPGAPFQLHLAWGWFLWVLIALTVVNRLATRYWLASLFVGGGQVLLLADQLPGLRSQLGVVGSLGGLGCFVTAILIVQLQLRATRVVSSGVDRVWIDFRDSFGVLWALRVAERVNLLAERHQWNVQLEWQGLRSRDQSAGMVAMEQEAEAILHQNLKNMLRRFVHADWLAQRLTGSSLPGREV